MNKKILVICGVIVSLIAVYILYNYSPSDEVQTIDETAEISLAESPTSKEVPVVLSLQYPDELETATFAGGCFWCTEAVLQEIDGVDFAVSGYAGGIEYNPTYEAVYTGSTSHKEAVRVYYDSSKVTYQEILETYWQSIDPTDSGGQFVDRGEPYTTAIYYETEEQKLEAESSKVALQNSGRFNEMIVTDILPFTTFYEAEAYHQDFYLNSKDRYKNYASNSGRDEFKAQVWQEIQNQ